MSGRLAGKTVLLTAAGQGIGRATATLCVAKGARVIATDGFYLDDLYSKAEGDELTQPEKVDFWVRNAHLSEEQLQRLWSIASIGPVHGLDLSTPFPKAEVWFYKPEDDKLR